MEASHSGVELNINNNELFFYPGHTIFGTIGYTVSKTSNIQGVLVALVGEEQTKWIQQTPDSIQKECKGANRFLSKEKILSEGTVCGQKCIQSFTFRLPRNIPGTYQNRTGWVKFFIRAKLLIELGEDQEIEKEIKVVSLIHFNRIVDSLRVLPFSVTAEKDIPFFSCFSVESIHMDVHFPKGAFLLGEEAKILVDIHNKSDRKIEMVELVLGQTITAKGLLQDDEVMIDQEVILHTSKCEGIPTYFKRLLKFVVEVPKSAEVPNFTRCRLLCCSCWIRVTATISNSNDHLAISTPIILGHTPVGAEIPDGYHVNHERAEELLQTQFQLQGGSTPYHPSAPDPPASLDERRSGLTSSIQELLISVPFRNTTEVSTNPRAPPQPHSNVSSSIHSSLDSSRSEEPPPSYESIYLNGIEPNAQIPSPRTVGWKHPYPPTPNQIISFRKKEKSLYYPMPMPKLPSYSSNQVVSESLESRKVDVRCVAPQNSSPSILEGNTSDQSL